MDATVAALILGATETNWAAITVAALTSSAVGAVVGGLLTTRQQSRHAREEAWRMRLIEAADDLNQLLVQGLGALGSASARLGQGDVPFHDTSGALTSECTEEIGGIRETLDQGRVQLGRVELLFSVDSDAYQRALASMHFSRRAVALIEGRPSAQRLVAAATAESKEAGTGHALLGPAPTALDYEDMDILVRHVDLPAAFDPTDAENVVSWVDVFRAEAGDHAHRFMRGARAIIETYRLPS